MKKEQDPRSKATFTTLYSTLRRRDAALLSLAILLSVLSGAVPTVMTLVIGDAFDAYTAYNPSSQSSSAISQERKDALMHGVTKSIWQLCILAACTMVLSTSMISLWIVVSERVAIGWRLRVYSAVSNQPMAWFDKGMGGNGADSEESSGAGGLMSKFAR